jgi:hypothetical protein
MIPQVRRHTPSASYRCCSCGQMKAAGTSSVWVPSTTMILSTDPAWVMLEAFQKPSPLGQELWCESCVMKVLRNTDAGTRAAARGIAESAPALVNMLNRKLTELREPWYRRVGRKLFG